MGFERLRAYTGDTSYWQYGKHIVDHFITNDGNIRTYVMDEYNSDFIPPGRQLLHLYERYKDDKYKNAAMLLRNQVSWQPRRQKNPADVDEEVDSAHQPDFLAGGH